MNRNYTAHGGKETVIGGKVTILAGAEVDIHEDATIKGLTVTKQPAEAPEKLHQPDSTATTVAALREDFNALLEILRNAGLLKKIDE